MWIIILLVISLAFALPLDDPSETTDGDHSRKILGSSVVTSVSVIMDTGNGTKAVYTDSLGRPLGKPTSSSELASPIDLLNPDRYEFYTFDDDGNLVRRLMSLDEIRGIIATGDSDGLEFDSLSAQNYIPENRVNDVLSNVQGVLKEEMELHKNKGDSKPVFDTPDVSDSWSMILPAIFGNSGADINPEKPQQHVTPDTIMIDTTPDVVSTKDYSVSIGSTIESVTQPVGISSSTQKLVVLQQADTTSERSPSSSLPLETKDSMQSTSTEASSVTTQKPDVGVTTGSEDVTKAGITQSPTILLTMGQDSTSTETSRIPEESSTNVVVSPQSTNTPQQERMTTSQLIFKSSINSQDFSSTVGLQQISSTMLPPASSTDGASPITVTTEEELPFSTNLPWIIFTVSEESSTESELTSSSTNPPTVSTKLSDPPSDLSSFFANMSSEKTTAITEEMSSSSANATRSPSDVLSSSTKLSTERTSLATVIISSTEQETPLITERTSAETETTTESRMVTYSTAIVENYATTMSYESNITKASTSIIDHPSSAVNSELETEIPDQSDNRFETTQQNANPAETEQATTDNTLMGSIQELLSQTLQNVDGIVMDFNRTDIPTTFVTVSTNEKAAEVTSTISPTSYADNIVSGEITEPSIYQIISSNSSSSSQNISRGEEKIANETITSNNDSPMMKITILNPQSATHNSQKHTSTSEGLSKNTKTDKTSEQNTTTTHLITTEVSKPDKVFATSTELYTTEFSTLSSAQLENLSTYAESTTDSANEKQSTEALIEPSIEIIINETGNMSSNNDTELSHNTTERPSISNIIISTEIITETPSTKGTPISISKPEKPLLKDTDKNESNWTLVPTVKPHSQPKKPQNTPSPSYPELIQPSQPIDLQPKPLQGFGLEDSTSTLDRDIYQYSQLCNELAFAYWRTVTTGLSAARSIFVSPFGVISLLAMIFLGARGSTSGEMNELLKLDDMVTFNPHLIFKNVSESIDLEKSNSGVVASAIIRELFSDKQRGMMLPFYKERAKAFYDGFVEEINFADVGDVIRRRTNLQVKKYSDGKVGEFLKDSFVTARSPLAGISVNVFQTDCSNTSTEGRDGEMHFVVLPSIRQRRLVPIPAVVYRSNFLAGYDPSLDATAVSLGTKNQIVSTILVIPGQQGMPAPGDGLARLEKSLVESSFKTGAWSRLLRSLIPRTGLEVQIPRVIHRSVINATMALKKLGFNELFDEDKADLRGMNGVQNELYLSDILQINSFTTCGELRNADSHHSEIYPANVLSRRLQKSLDETFLDDTRMTGLDPLFVDNEVPLPLRPRQARVPEMPRLRFDRPFLYFVRHNPTGLILHIGRFNPRLLP